MTDPESKGDPSCCYWGPAWTYSFIYIDVMYFFLSIVCSYQFYEAMTRRKKNTYQRSFFLFALIICLLRLLQVTLYIVFWDTDNVTRVVRYANQAISQTCSILFAQVYGIILVFWASFYYHMKTGNDNSKFASEVTFYLEIGSLVLINLNLFLCAFFIYQTSSYPQYHSSFFLILGLIMVFEGIAFFLVGFFLHKMTRSIPSADTQSPILLVLDKPLHEKSKKLSLMATIVTFMMLARAILLLIQIDFGRGESGLTATSTFVDYVRWHYYVIFYTFCEMLPIGLMVFFQWRLPKKSRSRMILTHYRDTAFDRMAEDCGSSISLDDSDLDISYEEM